MLLGGNLMFLEDRLTTWIRFGLVFILITCLLAASATSTNGKQFNLFLFVDLLQT